MPEGNDKLTPEQWQALSPRSLLDRVDVYNKDNNVEGFLQQMLISIFTNFPDDPYEYMAEFIQSHRDKKPTAKLLAMSNKLAGTDPRLQKGSKQETAAGGSVYSHEDTARSHGTSVANQLSCDITGDAINQVLQKEKKVADSSNASMVESQMTEN